MNHTYSNLHLFNSVLGYTRKKNIVNKISNEISKWEKCLSENSRAGTKNLEAFYIKEFVCISLAVDTKTCLDYQSERDRGKLMKYLQFRPLGR